MVPKLARPEFEAPVARIARTVDDALSGMRPYGRTPLWDEAVSATLAISRATSHLLRAQLVLLGNLAAGGRAEGPAIERFAVGRRAAPPLHAGARRRDGQRRAPAEQAHPPRGPLAAEPALEWVQLHDLAVVVGNVINVLAMRHLMPGADGGASHAGGAELVLEGCHRAGAGQFQDLLGFRGLGDDEEALRRELVDKTAYHAFAAPFGAGVRLGGADPERAIAWGCRVGLAFQAADDVADIASSPAVTGKDSLRDLLEGRPSLPLFFLRRRATGADRELLDRGARQALHRVRLPRPASTI
jgi:geranylgeranyl diphosphate synthase type I